jgi:cytochrome c peroxidase
LLVFRSAEYPHSPVYSELYKGRLNSLSDANRKIRDVLSARGGVVAHGDSMLITAVSEARLEMKRADFWLRYSDPGAYRLLNAPLPVEWETEVFEKFEKPYKREGGGYTLAYLEIQEATPNANRIAALLDSADKACRIFASDSLRNQIENYSHFYLCNRLFLLNLAAIYTTGFDCPDAERVVPELREMLMAVGGIYSSFNERFPDFALPADYMALYRRMTAFTFAQPTDASAFDHFSFIRDYVNPVYSKNQALVLNYNVVSKSLVDFSLSKRATSIFDKQLYNGQNAKGIFRRVEDSAVLADVEEAGRLLFYDPILSANNQRSCASCHKPGQCFTDTTVATALHFDMVNRLPRNTPSLVNSGFNHLLMADGRHFTLERQAKDVISNPSEMGCDHTEVVRKVLSCNKYRKSFKKMLQFTPQEQGVTIEHITSCLTWYYNKFSAHYSAFDSAMNGRAELDVAARRGFNLFMNRAQCATCHFVPQFNGVKPPYIGSEFEVLGVPGDKSYSRLSADSGRYLVNASKETLHAFRTGTVRNATRTAPYMHNGVFKTLREVIDFYDAGGGAGHNIDPGNQTLSADSLHLSEQDKDDLIAFMNSLTEGVPNPVVPERLPASRLRVLNRRKPGGIY